MTAIVLRGRVPNLSKPMRWGLFVAGLLCLRAAQAAVYSSDPVLPHNLESIAPRYLIALPGCLCLFFSCLQLPAGRLQKPFIYLGKISYGLYVFHVLWLGVARDLLKLLADGRLPGLPSELIAMAIALPATVVTGMVSYRYLESPFLRFKKRFTVVRSRPI
jgi:peptidoglycan/LPS O-acetylase OafA/YrhL